MRIVFATILLCIVFATAYADVRKDGDKYIETKTVEVDYGTIKDIKQRIDEIKHKKAIYERELSGYENQYNDLIAQADAEISGLEANFKTDIDADDAVIAQQANVETP